jgi:hypothetical protein
MIELLLRFFLTLFRPFAFAPRRPSSLQNIRLSSDVARRRAQQCDGSDGWKRAQARIVERSISQSVSRVLTADTSVSAQLRLTR